ncbi:MAG: cysteine desulfurase family protein [Clostridia bacterium]|nr:cysteine desulfurase family protein [Clostridia bacterium]
MIYFDNASTTKPTKDVIDIMAQANYTNFANASSLHKIGNDSKNLLEASRKQIADFLSIKSDDLYFTSGGTESNNIMLIGSALKNLKSRGNIITDRLEHPSVIEACKIAELLGTEIRFVKSDKDGKIDLANLQELIDEKTLLCSFMLVNNETGVVNPIEQAAEIIHSKNQKTLLHCDAVQGFTKINLPTKDIDAFSVSSHKIHGPKGIGALYLKNKNAVRTPVTGGGQEKNLRGGTEALPIIMGFAKAVSASVKQKKNVYEINKYLRKELTKIKDVVINSPDDASDYILNISILPLPSEVARNALSMEEIYVSSGSACTKGHESHVLVGLNLPKDRRQSAIRLSFSDYNTLDEAKVFVEKLKEIITKYGVK